MVLNKIVKREAARLNEVKKEVSNNPTLWILFNKIFSHLGASTVVRVADDPKVEFNVGVSLDNVAVPSEFIDTTGVMIAKGYISAFRLVTKEFKSGCLTETQILKVVDAWDSWVTKDSARLFELVIDENVDRVYLMNGIASIVYTNLDEVFAIRTPISQMEQLIINMMEQRERLIQLQFYAGQPPFKPVKENKA